MRLHDLTNLAARLKVKTIVTNDVLFHEPSRHEASTATLDKALRGHQCQSVVDGNGREQFAS
ncbi:hypothetical protein [Rhizobium azibense]|uniref:hypothetical protein n=1 Tax=Rhizobium azibense TaxID=1136135 RepID=UPI00104BADF4|nr:hypothetical protein [Rhizobium azibense]